MIFNNYSWYLIIIRFFIYLLFLFQIKIFNSHKNIYDMCINKWNIIKIKSTFNSIFTIVIYVYTMYINNEKVGM